MTVKRYIWNASDVPYDAGYFTSDDGVQPDPEDGAQFVLATAYDALAADNARLKAERDALRRDALRYRWLRSLAFWKHEPSRLHAPLIEWSRASALCDDGVDMAIDAAMAATTPSLPQSLPDTKERG